MGTDGAYAHREYAATHNIQFPLLSDTDGQVSRAYGVLTEEFEGHIVQFAWSAHGPGDQPDLDALRKAANCRGGRYTVEEADESA